MVFDPFNDFETKGYLRNNEGLKDYKLVKRLESNSVQSNLRNALCYLKSQDDLSYDNFLETHKILFSDIYPWAGQDRSITAPNIAITKAGRSKMFAHPLDVKRAAEYALNIGSDIKIMQKKPGEVMGLLAYSHPFLDGNGRTIIAIHEEMCRRALISIDWENTNQKNYLVALTKELEQPQQGHLDNYLKPFVHKKIRTLKKTQEVLTYLPGLNRDFEKE